MDTCTWVWPLADKVELGGICGNPASSFTNPSANGSVHAADDHSSSCSTRLCFDETPSTRQGLKVDTGLEIRMPELSSPCSSPGARQDNEANSSMPRTWNPPKPPRGRSSRKKRTTASDAYNKGMLLQYIIENLDDCCGINGGTSDFESNWDGHQPLASATWETPFENEDLESVLSASEQRTMRRRRRRGIPSPPRSLGRNSSARISPMKPTSMTIGEDGGFFVTANQLMKTAEPKLPGYGIAFPGDLEDPHLHDKKKWQPKCEKNFSGDSDSTNGTVDG